MKLQEKLKHAGITQKQISEECMVSEQYVSMVLAGSRTSLEVTNEARRLLKEVLKKKPALKTYFESEGI